MLLPTNKTKTVAVNGKPEKIITLVDNDLIEKIVTNRNAAITSANTGELITKLTTIRKVRDIAKQNGWL